MLDIESLLKVTNAEAFALKYAYGRALAAQVKKRVHYPYKSVSVIIASRLQRDPTGRLWLERALGSIFCQSVRSNLDIEIIVGVDEDAEVPENRNIKVVKSEGKSQAHALNAAVSVAQGEVLAFLEDDDVWHAKRLDEGLIALGGFDFVSSNQLEYIVDVNALRLYQNINDYATPSGWMLKRDLFNKIGPFDVSYKYHLDTEWLGRLNRFGATRCHMVEKGCLASSSDMIVRHRTKLAVIMYQSAIGSCLWNSYEDNPLVYRALHPESGMGQIANNMEAAIQSQNEHRRIKEVNKTNVW